MAWTGRHWSCFDLSSPVLGYVKVARLWCLIKVNWFMPLKVNGKYYKQRYVHTEFWIYGYTVTPLGAHIYCVFSALGLLNLLAIYVCIFQTSSIQTMGNITNTNVPQIGNFSGVYTRKKVWAQVNTLRSEINDKRREGAAVPQNCA